MDIKAIRKLPELQENQEWACEGGCDVIKPKYFENVFSQSTAHDGSSIKRQSEFFWTCQNNHFLRVWCTDQSDYILLPEDFYQAEAPKVVESNSIQESIDLLDQDIESIKNTFLEESLLTNEDADTLEQLITKAMQLGEFYAKRDAQAQAVPEGFVLVPKKPDADKAWNIALKRIVPPTKTNDPIQKELMCKKHIDDLCSEQDRILLNFEAMIEAQEQSHD